MKTLIITALLSLSTFATAVFADSYTVGDLTINDPYARSTPPSAPVGGGFMTITNHGKAADQLITGTSSFAEAVEIHEMVMVDGVMKMGQVEGGLEIPAGETVALKPGSYHIMFIGLEEQLKPDERRKGVMKFANAGEVEIEFLVKDITKMMDHSKMGEMKHDTKEIDHSAMGEMKHDAKMGHSDDDMTSAETK